MVYNTSLSLRARRRESFGDDLIERRCGTFNSGGQRITPKRSKAHHTNIRLFTGLERQSVIIDHDPLAMTLDDRALGSKVQGNDRNVLLTNVGPNVGFSPIGKWKYSYGFAGV